MTQAQLLNTRQAADILGIHRSTLLRWARAGSVPTAYQNASGTMFYAEDVDAIKEAAAAIAQAAK